MTGLVTSFTYPEGTEYVSSTVSEGSMNASGSKWTGVDVLEGESATISIYVDIVDEDRFSRTDKTIKGVTTKYPAEVVIENNVILKVIE